MTYTWIANGVHRRRITLQPIKRDVTFIHLMKDKHFHTLTVQQVAQLVFQLGISRMIELYVTDALALEAMVLPSPAQGAANPPINPPNEGDE